jgi:hypothetical protein
MIGEPRTHFFRRFHFFNLVERGIPRLFGRERESDEAYLETRSGRPLVLRLLRAIQEAAADHGARFLVAICESYLRDDHYLALERFLEAREIPYFHLESRKIPQTNLWRDRHLSPHGHELLAEGLLELVGAGA